MTPSPILVVDDDPLLLMLLEHKLLCAGYVVATAPDGLAAMQAIPVIKPGIIVLDAMMPRMDGFEVLRRIRSDASFRDLRIIMLTVLRHQDDVVGALKLGADDFLVKPFIPDELLARVARLAQREAA
jgi:DNA-binding response OmpR family regulator